MQCNTPSQLINLYASNQYQYQYQYNNKYNVMKNKDGIIVSEQ